MSLAKPLIDHAVAELTKREANWEEFSVIWNLDTKYREPNNSWGCWFGPGPNSTPESLAVSPWDVETDLQAYLDDLYPDDHYPIRILLQFNRTSGRYNIEVEDTDTNRWKVSPADYKEAKEALRPNLGNN